MYKNHSKRECTCFICKAKRGEYKKENSPNYGKKITELHKNDCKCTICQFSRGEILGEKHHHFGKTLEEIHGKKCNCGFCKSKRGERKGKNCNFYIDGRTPLVKSIRNLEKYAVWRTKVFKRDNYICQACGHRGGNIEAHHNIIPFQIIFESFIKKYKNYPPIKNKQYLLSLSLNWKPFWKINNGITLCSSCHEKTKKGSSPV